MFYNSIITKEKIKNLSGFILPAFLWLLIWGTYNTDITRIFSSGFPHSFFDILHGVRSFFPFIALILAILILIKGRQLPIKIFKGPFGFLMLYAFVGIIASLFSTNPWLSFYWGVLYLSAMFVLLALLTRPDFIKNISFIFYLNFAIAIGIASVLMLVFFSQSGGFSFITLIQFLQGRRPYEGINNIGADIVTLGMAGTRPTGLGRYAGLSALLMLTFFWHHKRNVRIIFYSLFAIFFPILIFTRARTSVVAFAIAIILMMFFKAKLKSTFVFISVSLLLLLSMINFFPFAMAYLNNENLLQEEVQVTANIPNKKKVIIDNKNSKQYVIFNQVVEVPNNINNNTSSEDSFNTVVTLSGRTTGIWPASWELFLKSPFVGFGFFADRIFLQGQHAHNLLLQALVQAGTFGTSFFLLALISSWFLSIKLFLKFPQNNILLGAIGMLAYFTVRGITESFVFFGADYLFIVPVMAYLQILYFKEEK